MSAELSLCLSVMLKGAVLVFNLLSVKSLATLVMM